MSKEKENTIVCPCCHEIYVGDEIESLGVEVDPTSEYYNTSTARCPECGQEFEVACRIMYEVV